jgi:hypothetical protein
MKYAKAWEPYANITFVKVGAKDASDIRVGFKINGDQGSWSYLGRDALRINATNATMNFGWFTNTTGEKEFSRVVTHEFGHAIGLAHEQASPVASIPWNKPAVYAYYAGSPNYWTRAQVDYNIFFKYGKKTTQYSVYDSKSIMQYVVDRSFTTNGSSIGSNYVLSNMDKTFIATVYPKSTGIN